MRARLGKGEEPGESVQDKIPQSSICDSPSEPLLILSERKLVKEAATEKWTIERCYLDLNSMKPPGDAKNKNSIIDFGSASYKYKFD